MHKIKRRWCSCDAGHFDRQESDKRGIEESESKDEERWINRKKKKRHSASFFFPPLLLASLVSINWHASLFVCLLFQLQLICVRRSEAHETHATRLQETARISSFLLYTYYSHYSDAERKLKKKHFKRMIIKKREKKKRRRCGRSTICSNLLTVSSPSETERKEDKIATAMRTRSSVQSTEHFKVIFLSFFF